MSRNSASAYFDLLNRAGSDDPSYTYGDVAKHFKVSAATVRTSLINYLAKKGIVDDNRWMIDRKPATEATVREPVAFSDEMIEFAQSAPSFKSCLERFPSEPKNRIMRLYRQHRADPDRGRMGRAAFDLWKAAVESDSPVDWSAINKAVGGRSPSYVSSLVANEAKRRGVDGPEVRVAKSNFKATDEQKALLGTKLDSELASDWGISVSAVASLRRREGVKAPVRVSASMDYSGETGKRAYEAVVTHKTFIGAVLNGGLGMTVAQVRDAAMGYAAAHGLPTDGLGAKTGRRKS